MSGKARFPYVGLAAVFLLVLLGWLVSGREVFTKHLKVVSVTAQDPLFGGTETHQEFVPGPVFGYYIGLDLVVLSVVICGVIALVVWGVQRRRLRRKES